MKYMRSIPRSIPPKQTPKHTSEAYPLDKPSGGDTVFPDEPIYIYIHIIYLYIIIMIIIIIYSYICIHISCISYIICKWDKPHKFTRLIIYFIRGMILQVHYQAMDNMGEYSIRIHQIGLNMGEHSTLGALIR